MKRPPTGHAPNFDEFLRVLNRERPSRPVLYELFLNDTLHSHFTGTAVSNALDPDTHMRRMIAAYAAAGYDYTPVLSWITPLIGFPTGPVQQLSTRSLNEGGVIGDRMSFDAYAWPDPDRADYDAIGRAARALPRGMQFVITSPGGILENAISLVGYERLGLLLAEDPGLVRDLFDRVGAILLRHYERALEFDRVGAAMCNDDWGFKTQTMLAPADMRRLVFPWYRKIVALCHRRGRPALLHSCGNLREVMDDVIDDLRFDAKHSFEDAIQPVEEAYEEYGGRIAILGGIDVHFLCTQPAAAIRARARNLLRRSRERGGYALGSGNSIPDYLPLGQYLAMIAAARDPL